MRSITSAMIDVLPEAVQEAIFDLKDVLYTGRTTSQLALACLAALTLRTVVWTPFRLYFLTKYLPPAVKLREIGRWAVITGATDGVGKQYALKLASLGLDIVLISRSAEKLAKVQTEISTTYGREVRTIQVDFSATDIYEKISNGLEGLDIAILINNVGVSTPKFAPFLETPKLLESSSHILNVNCLSMTNMCSLVMPHMIEKRRGVIVNIASCLGVYGSTHSTVYAATKSYNLMLSDCLHRHYNNTGVIIQTLTPGMIRTKLLSTLTYEEDTFIKRLTVPLISTTQEDFVASAINTIGRSSLCHGHAAHYYLDIITWFLPIGVFDWLVSYH